MASRQATSRLRKELQAILKDPPPHIHVSCDESNILLWSYLLEGPPDTPYAGGWYWGRLRFPKNYPFSPPSILMMTPSGRFETNTRLCLSMSDYHPESWQPGWSLATVLKGLLSFMCEESPTTGAVHPPPPLTERQRLAAASIQWNQAQADFVKAFPEFDQIIAAAAANTAHCGQSGAGDGCREHDSTVECQEGEAHIEPPQFAKGSVVRLRGLKGRMDLNGCKGVIEELDAPAKGRLQVRVGDESLGVRPTNLELAEVGEDFERVDDEGVSPS